MKFASISLLATLVMMAPGCLIEGPDEHCYGDYGPGNGDIGFWWNFELADGSVTDDCFTAEVARIDTRVYDDCDNLEYEVEDRPCEDLGLVMTNFDEGMYYLEMTAHCRSGITTHEGQYEIWVEPGNNEYGDLVLDYLRPCM